MFDVMSLDEVMKGLVLRQNEIFAVLCTPISHLL